MTFHDINSNVVHTVNATSVTTTAAAVLGWLPPLLAALASFFTVLWMAVQIYESKTVREWLKRKFKK